MRSMTGFGQATGENGRHRITVTVRALNHRFLELRVRMPEGRQEQEPLVREVLGEELARGRVDAGVEVWSLGERRAEVEIERGVLLSLHAACHDLAERGLIRGELEIGDLLRLPEVLRVRLLAEGWELEDSELLRRVTREAREQLIAARRHEGGQIAAALAAGLDELRALVVALSARSRAAQQELGDALRARVAELLAGQGLPDERLAQEVALLIDRSDVREELDRLAAHCDHFASLMAAGGALGKRLDFLTQEIFRELNTLGSKCRDAEMIRAVLDAKVICEQLREQVQNVE